MYVQPAEGVIAETPAEKGGYAQLLRLADVSPRAAVTEAWRNLESAVDQIAVNMGIANRCKRENVQRCRELLGLSRELPEVVNQLVQEMMIKLTGKDITLCPCCGKGKMRQVCLIPEGCGSSGYDILHPSG